MRKIVIVGGELSSSVFSRWYRIFNQRNKITIITDTQYPAFYRSVLPLIVSGDIGVKEALAFTPQYLSLFSDIILIKDVREVKVDEKMVTLGTGDEIEYDKLIIASGTSPLIEGYPLRNIEEAVKLRDIIKDKDKVVKIYGGLQGLWAGEVLSSKGFNVEVFTDPSTGFYREYFDDDIWNFALKIAEHKFKLTDKRLTKCDNSLKIIYGYEKARLPTLNIELPLREGILTDNLMRVNENVYALGSVSQPKDEIFGHRFVPISDYVTAVQGVVAALSMFERNVRGVLQSFSLKIGKIYLFSAGYTKSKAERYGIKVATTRLAVPLKDVISGDGKVKVYVKAIGDRERGRLIGVQIIGPYEALILGSYAYSLILWRSTIDSFMSLVSPYIPGEIFNINPVLKSLHALWRKTLEF
ncbi:MAG: hypothetical protein DRJ41_01695 [Thermoprotei archaeon]|nr:MAG: hypothetical protein DRJ41_01695 [Thermoprotei archaeon]